MSLKEELKGFIGNKRRFLLLRIAEVDPNTARKFTGIQVGTYNSWLQQGPFVEIYRRVHDLTVEYKQEAIQLLRRSNQLDAVLLEGEIIQKMKEEIQTGQYSLVRTHLAREVYTRLLSDLDKAPETQNLTWFQKVEQLIVSPQGQLPEGEVVDGVYTVKD